MKRVLGVTLAVALVVLLAGAALAFMGPGGGPMRMGGMMGMGPGMMGPGQPGCPGMGTTTTEAITRGCITPCSPSSSRAPKGRSGLSTSTRGGT